MNRREQIIIAAASLAALYGLYEFVGKPLFTTSQEAYTPVEVGKMVALTAEAGGSKEHRQQLDAILSRMEQPWNQESFLPTSLQQAQADTGDDKAITEQPLPEEAALTYTGFLQMGNQAIAIINGIDYSDKDIVNGYTILQITSDSVLLQNAAGRYRLNIKEGKQ